MLQVELLLQYNLSSNTLSACVAFNSSTFTPDNCFSVVSCFPFPFNSSSPDKSASSKIFPCSILCSPNEKNRYGAEASFSLLNVSCS